MFEVFRCCEVLWLVFKFHCVSVEVCIYMLSNSFVEVYVCTVDFDKSVNIDLLFKVAIVRRFSFLANN